MGLSSEHARQLLATSKTALRGMDLTGIDLSFADLRGQDLSHTKLNGAKLRGTLIDDGTKLEGADIDGADFEGSQATCGNDVVINRLSSSYRELGGLPGPVNAKSEHLGWVLKSKSPLNADRASFDNSAERKAAGKAAADNLRKMHESGELDKLHQQANAPKPAASKEPVPEYARSM